MKVGVVTDKTFTPTQTQRLALLIMFYEGWFLFFNFILLGLKK